MRYSLLLFSLLLLAVLNPLLEEIGFIKASILLNISLTIILLFGTLAATRTIKTFLFFFVLAALPIVLAFLKPYIHGWNVDLTVQILIASYFMTIAISMLKPVLKNEKVTWEKISAALCVYLLIGIIWAFFYSIVTTINPQSFKIAGGGFSPFVYYSMITLTTVGYGDITPMTPFTRSLAFVEAVTGQFYLTVLVARLVGLHIVHESNS